MPPALTPALALEYVHELSADVRAGIVLDAAGHPLAGPPGLAGPASELLSAAGDAAALEAATADGVVCAVRTGAHAAVAVCGRFAIGSVVRQDLRVALAALEGREPAVDAGEKRALAALHNTNEPALTSAANRLISAVQRHSGA
jgi:hypothetical protein